jgi:hypothetical protein
VSQISYISEITWGIPDSSRWGFSILCCDTWLGFNWRQAAYRSSASRECPSVRKGTFSTAVNQRQRCGWRRFADWCARGAGEWSPSLRLFLLEYKYGDCMRSIGTFGLMAAWTKVVQSVIEIGHKFTKNVVWNIIYNSTITHVLTVGSFSCAHHQGVLGSGFMAPPVLKLGIRWG